jgi:hypothetical protein
MYEQKWLRARCNTPFKADKDGNLLRPRLSSAQLLNDAKAIACSRLCRTCIRD